MFDQEEEGCLINYGDENSCSCPSKYPKVSEFILPKQYIPITSMAVARRKAPPIMSGRGCRATSKEVERKSEQSERFE